MLLRLIGTRIKYIRKIKGITQEELAEKAGINATYIGTVERGQRNISLDTLEKIIEGLSVTPTELFQFHETGVDDHKISQSEVLEMFKSLLINRTLEENKLIFRVVKDILTTLDNDKR